MREYAQNNESGYQERQLNYRFCNRISNEEVRDTLRMMKTGKATGLVGLDRIPVEI